MKWHSSRSNFNSHKERSYNAHLKIAQNFLTRSPPCPVTEICILGYSRMRALSQAVKKGFHNVQVSDITSGLTLVRNHISAPTVGGLLQQMATKWTTKEGIKNWSNFIIPLIIFIDPIAANDVQNRFTDLISSSNTRTNAQKC